MEYSSTPLVLRVPCSLLHVLHAAHVLHRTLHCVSSWYALLHLCTHVCIHGSVHPSCGGNPHPPFHDVLGSCICPCCTTYLRITYVRTVGTPTRTTCSTCLHLLLRMAHALHGHPVGSTLYATCPTWTSRIPYSHSVHSVPTLYVCAPLQYAHTHSMEYVLLRAVGVWLIPSTWG